MYYGVVFAVFVFVNFERKFLALHSLKCSVCPFYPLISNLSFLSTAAFTKMITINGQEYHLQLVDTAGQV